MVPVQIQRTVRRERYRDDSPAVGADRFAIADGEPGMPAWRDALSEREFEELVAYISSVAKQAPGDDYWHNQIVLRGEAMGWRPEDTRRLEAYARRLIRE